MHPMDNYDSKQDICSCPMGRSSWDQAYFYVSHLAKYRLNIQPMVTLTW